MSYKDRSVLVCDCGLFVSLAETLADTYGKVGYWTPWQSAFPRSNDFLVGQGLPGIELVEDLWDDLDKWDLFVFPDVNHGPLQVHLSDLGKRVWGSGLGEELELNRELAKKHLASIGVPIGQWKPIKGLDALRKHLKEHDNQWVKVSRTRGDFESFHAKNYRNIEPKLDELEHTLGAKKSVYPFIVEDGIDDAVEIGYDGYCVDGVFPGAACVGVEVKDVGYVGRFLAEGRMPRQITELNRMVGPTLREYGYKNFFAMEARITRSGTPWVIDPLCRAGSPPSEMLQIMYTNLPNIFWEGAGGKCIDPLPAAEWGAELLIHSQFADKNWVALDIPDDVRPYVKLRNHCRIGGIDYVVPQSVGLPEIGAVAAVGDTMEAAIRTCKARAEKVSGYDVQVFEDSLEKAVEEIDKLRRFGIDF